VSPLSLDLLVYELPQFEQLRPISFWDRTVESACATERGVSRDNLAKHACVPRRDHNTRLTRQMAVYFKLIYFICIVYLKNYPVDIPFFEILFVLTHHSCKLLTHHSCSYYNRIVALLRGTRTKMVHHDSTHFIVNS